MMIALDSIAHINALAEILKDLEQDGIRLYEHHYQLTTFGSFTVVLGRPYKQVKFDWDGHETTLIVSFSDFSSQGSEPAWVHDMDVKLPNVEGLYAEIASNAADMLAI
jgi:hypothetical protein